jgi:hypothetical protein
MDDEMAETGSRGAVRDVKAELDERRIARGVAIGLPLVTVTVALAAGVMIGPAMAVLALAAGTLLGVIALLWASLRVLSGEAPLSPELEALDTTTHAVDALSSRKRMLVRALKDLDNERALGKLEDGDHEQLSATYRGELKEVMKRIDASLEPYRAKAEDAARAHLMKAGLVEGGYRGEPPPEAPSLDEDDDDAVRENEPTERDAAPKNAKKKKKAEPPRMTCSACATSNEVDATFCKKCGASLAKDVGEATAQADAATGAEADIGVNAKETADEA